MAAVGTPGSIVPPPPYKFACPFYADATHENHMPRTCLKGCSDLSHLHEHLKKYHSAPAANAALDHHLLPATDLQRIADLFQREHRALAKPAKWDRIYNICRPYMLHQRKFGPRFIDIPIFFTLMNYTFVGPQGNGFTIRSAQAAGTDMASIFEMLGEASLLTYLPPQIIVHPEFDPATPDFYQFTTIDAGQLDEDLLGDQQQY